MIHELRDYRVTCDDCGAIADFKAPKPWGDVPPRTPQGWGWLPRSDDYGAAMVGAADYCPRCAPIREARDLKP